MICSVLAGVLSVVCSVPTARAQTELVFARAKHLRRGINLSNWYARTGNNDCSAARLASYMTSADFQLIHDLGFDHARLSINPEPLLGG